MTETSTRPITRVARNITAIALSTTLARGMQFIWGILLAQILGASDYGTWGVIGGMISIAATLPEFGMGVIVLRDVAQKPDEADKYLGVTLAVQPLLACAAYLLLMGAVVPYDAPTRLLVAIAGISLLVDVLGNMGYNQLLVTERMVITSVISVAHILFQIVCSLAVLLTGGGLAGLYIATLCAGLLRAVLFWVALRQVHIKPLWPPQWKIVRRLFGDGLPLAMSAVMGLINQHFDKILVFSILSKAETGYLTAAYFIAFGISELVSTTVLVALFPLMARMVQAEHAALMALTERLAFITVIIILPIGIGISGLAGRLASLLFHGFVGTAGALEILIWSSVVAIVAAVYSQAMIVTNRQGRVFAIRVCIGIISIVMNLLLIPRLSLPGAAISALTAQLVGLALLIANHRPVPEVRRDLASRLLRVLVSGVAMAVCIVLLRDVNAVLAGIVCTVVYIAGLLLLGAFGAEEWDILGRFVFSLPVVGDSLNRRFSKR